jgi:2-oxoglutarate dehydrogenase E1 component
VKYHLGASSDREFDGNRVHLSLTANPSHLEIVNPVVLGKVRAKQDYYGATRDDRTMVMPLLISGDARFAGQGVIAECFGLSGCAGTAPAAPCTSSSTTRSASPPIRAIRVPRRIRPTSPR